MATTPTLAMDDGGKCKRFMAMVRGSDPLADPDLLKHMRENLARLRNKVRLKSV